jgi:HSP20 family protein
MCGRQPIANNPMTLMKYRQPRTTASPVDRLASEIFGQRIGHIFGSDGFQDHSPRVNIVENDEVYRLEVQVPGFDKKDLKVSMVNDTLTISGEHTEDERTEGEATRYTRREFGRVAFERSFVLPQLVKSEGIKAECANGVLQLTIPKNEESKPKTRTITIA